jgi:hypothetical protein
MSNPAATYLTEQLERLMALPLVTKADLNNWIAESDKVLKTLEDTFPGFEPSDNFFHFVADPDIRLRDKQYADYQHKLMWDYISKLRDPSHL